MTCACAILVGEACLFAERVCFCTCLSLLLLPPLDSVATFSKFELSLGAFPSLLERADVASFTNQLTLDAFDLTGHRSGNSVKLHERTGPIRMYGQARRQREREIIIERERETEIERERER